MLSVIISTRNRPRQLAKCLKSLSRSSFKDWELILLDQSSNNETRKIIGDLRKVKIKYFKLKYTGKARAINFGVEKASGEILGFTDDDCVVSKNWAKLLGEILSKNKELSAVFGRTLRYNSVNHRGKTCVSVQDLTERILFDKPYPRRFDFLGNCMGIKRNILRKSGGFKEWLGVGSIANACEDEEIAFRLLAKGKRILYEPSLIVYHDRWLQKKEYEKLMYLYSVGFFAAFTYHFLRGSKLALKYLILFSLTNLKAWFKEFATLLDRSHFGLAIVKVFDILKNILNWRYYLKGLLIGTYFGIKDSSRLNTVKYC